jgi:hypothetical protein
VLLLTQNLGMQKVALPLYTIRILGRMSPVTTTLSGQGCGVLLLTFLVVRSC